MKALKKDGHNLAVKNAPKPSLKNDDDVLIHVALAGVCRTDIYVSEGKIPAQDSLILGHEFSGFVEDAGNKVQGLCPGDRVVVNPLIPCLDCPLCKTGRTEICQDSEFLGINRNGGFAEFCIAPHQSLHVFSESVPLVEAAYAEPLAASLAVLKTGIQPQDKGLIYGDNRIAKLTLKVLEAYGFQNVDVYDAANAQNLPKANAYDFAIETIAATEILNHLIGAIRPGGKIIIKSRTCDPVTLIPIDLMRKEPIFHVVNYGSFDDAIELLKSKRIRVDDLIDDLYPLENFKEVFRKAQHTETHKPFFSFLE